VKGRIASFRVSFSIASSPILACKRFTSVRYSASRPFLLTLSASTPARWYSSVHSRNSDCAKPRLRAASGTEILPLRTSRMIATLRCAIHRSNFSGSGAGGGTGCDLFLIEHLRFAYQVSGSRGGHNQSGRTVGKICGVKAGKKCCGCGRPVAPSNTSNRCSHITPSYKLPYL
jgi:hypothetical protein